MCSLSPPAVQVKSMPSFPSARINFVNFYKHMERESRVWTWYKVKSNISQQKHIQCAEMIFKAKIHFAY